MNSLAANHHARGGGESGIESSVEKETRSEERKPCGEITTSIETGDGRMPTPVIRSGVISFDAQDMRQVVVRD
jgi:hypothetical protein